MTPLSHSCGGLLSFTVLCDGAACRFDYRVDERRAERFYGEIRKYFPALPDNALQADYSGIRPKIYGQGEPAADFMIQVQFCANVSPRVLYNALLYSWLPQMCRTVWPPHASL